MNNNFAPEYIAEKLKILPGIEAQKLMKPHVRTLQPAPSSAKKAAVLIVLYYKQNQLSTVFIQRPEYNGAHSGQISLPGGMHECSDSNMLATAIREANEEIGVNPHHINILGALTPLYIEVSNTNVHPFVAFSEKIIDFRIDTKEVVHIIETPVSYFSNPENRHVGNIKVRDKDIEAPWYDIQGKQIWGATAMIMAEFSTCISK
jgi:8-oxo-dGTP pyrophosphatase MutT (NUDIX family)